MNVSSVIRKVSDHAIRRVVRRSLRSQSWTATPKPGPVLVFAPHQDDETLGCGGLIAMKREAGERVHVVFLTDGSACYNAATPGVGIAADEIIRTRQDEAVAALGSLGVSRDAITFLDHVDGELGLLTPADRATLVSRLAELIRSNDPAQLLIPHGSDVHPDHLATHALVSSAVDATEHAVDVWQYLIWSLWNVDHLAEFRRSGCPGLRNVAIGPARAKKREALAHYRSQFEPVGEARFRAVPKRLRTYVDIPYELFVVERWPLS